MTKEDVQKKIKSARQSHTYQIQKIKFLVEGVPLKEEPTPVSYRECGFGSWMYGDEEMLCKLVGEKSFKEIEQLHILWHTEYQKIYQIYYGEAKKGLFSRFSSGRLKVDSQQKESARGYFNDLQKLTYTLLNMLKSLEHSIDVMPNSYFGDK